MKYATFRYDTAEVENGLNESNFYAWLYKLIEINITQWSHWEAHNINVLLHVIINLHCVSTEINL